MAIAAGRAGRCVRRALSSGGAREGDVVVVTRGIPDSFVACLRHDATQAIGLAAARAEHAAYCAALAANPRVAGVVALAADEACADSPFVEDTAVVLGATALVTRPGAPPRRAEVGPVRALLAGTRLAVSALAPPATLDGGDVLVAGAHVFVGASQRTNAAGFAGLRAALASPAAPPAHFAAVPVAGALHLKTLATWAGADVGFVVADTAGGRAVADHLAEHYTRLGLARPPVILVPDIRAANVLRIGDTLYHSAACKKSTAILQAEVRRRNAHITLVPLHLPEMNKADAAITCCSLILPADLARGLLARTAGAG